MNKTIEFMLVSAAKGRLLDASDFLKEVYSGAPIDDVISLLESENDFLASEGAWVLSEVGAAARHLVSLFPRMATHSHFKVRFWSVDYALTVLGIEDIEYVPYLLKLLTDQDLRVRAHAIILFRNLDIEIFCNFIKNKVANICNPTEFDLSYIACKYEIADIQAGVQSSEIGIRSISIMRSIKNKEMLSFVKNLTPEEMSDDLAFVLEKLPAFS